MTETQKQILELIEPYMDKTLSSKHIFNKIIYTIQGFNKTGTSFITKLLHTGFEEIGHYDITAVLKYISSQLGTNKYVTGFYFENFENHTTLRFWKQELDEKEFKMNFKQTIIVEERQIERIVGSAYRLPNKPLQLYTEEENKNLLDLLIIVSTTF